MGKKDEDKLRHDLALHRAMQLDKYKEPPPVDVEAMLAASKETSRLGGTIARGYVCGAAGAVSCWFNKRRTEFNTAAHDEVFADPTLALIAYRNKQARRHAERLAELDEEIAKFITGSGLIGTSVVADVKPFTDKPHKLGEGVVWTALPDRISLNDISDNTQRTMVIALLKKNGHEDGNDHAAVAEAYRRVVQADDATKAELTKLVDKTWADAAGNDPSTSDAAIEARKKADDAKFEAQAKPPRKAAKKSAKASVKKSAVKGKT